MEKKLEKKLEDICTALKAIEPTIDDTHYDLFSKGVKKVDQTIRQGITTWIKKNDLGHIACYYQDSNSANYIATRTIIKGEVVSEDISGRYCTGNSDEVSISLKHEIDSPSVTCYVFLNGKLIVSRIDPTSFAEQNAKAFLQSLCEARGEDSTLLNDRTEQEIPLYALATKLIKDFLKSQINSKTTERMYRKLKSSNSANLVVKTKTTCNK